MYSVICWPRCSDKKSNALVDSMKSNGTVIERKIVTLTDKQLESFLLQVYFEKLKKKKYSRKWLQDKRDYVSIDKDKNVVECFRYRLSKTAPKLSGPQSPLKTKWRKLLTDHSDDEWAGADYIHVTDNDEEANRVWRLFSGGGTNELLQLQDIDGLLKMHKKLESLVEFRKEAYKNLGPSTDLFVISGVSVFACGLRPYGDIDGVIFNKPPKSADRFLKQHRDLGVLNSKEWKQSWSENNEKMKSLYGLDIFGAANDPEQHAWFMGLKITCPTTSFKYKVTTYSMKINAVRYLCDAISLWYLLNDPKHKFPFFSGNPMAVQTVWERRNYTNPNALRAWLGSVKNLKNQMCNDQTIIKGKGKYGYTTVTGDFIVKWPRVDKVATEIKKEYDLMYDNHTKLQMAVPLYYGMLHCKGQKGLMMEAFDGTLNDWMQKKRNTRDWMELCANVWWASLKLAEAGIIHNDMSKNNVVYKKIRTDKVIKVGSTNVDLNTWDFRVIDFDNVRLTKHSQVPNMNKFVSLFHHMKAISVSKKYPVNVLENAVKTIDTDYLKKEQRRLQSSKTSIMNDLYATSLSYILIERDHDLVKSVEYDLVSKHPKGIHDMFERWRESKNAFDDMKTDIESYFSSK